jgi:hypothetical protein
MPTLYPRTRLGDTDNSGTVDAVDIVRATNHHSDPSGFPLTIFEFFNADVNTDLQVTPVDAEAIAEITVESP